MQNLAVRYGHPTGDYYLLRLNKCDASSDWSIHGLWYQRGCQGVSECQRVSECRYQNADGCGDSFSESQITDLEPTMDKAWLSCPQYVPSALPPSRI